MRHECEAERVFCTYSKVPATATEYAENSTPSTTNSHVPTGYHPTATPPPLPETHITAQPQITGTTNNGLWFQNYQDTNQPRSSTTTHTSFTNNMSPASSSDIMEAITPLLTQVVNKKDNVSKQMMKNI